ncbi:hypothetical protein EVAR_52041_1 [Eumeta japonica]|uniref:Uncharacterized protein n=1 Tax=Eumeta variegata TaxID=151549 RepID=A0A4C1Z6D0_EUMVA|nr:hypothetical protein EVAR_52041_1 [Eumeta japonica]
MAEAADDDDILLVGESHCEIVMHTSVRLTGRPAEERSRSRYEIALVVISDVAEQCCARGRPIIVEWERDARHSAGLSRSVTHRYVTEPSSVVTSGAFFSPFGRFDSQRSTAQSCLFGAAGWVWKESRPPVRPVRRAHSRKRKIARRAAHRPLAVHVIRTHKRCKPFGPAWTTSRINYSFFFALSTSSSPGRTSTISETIRGRCGRVTPQDLFVDLAG